MVDLILERRAEGTAADLIEGAEAMVIASAIEAAVGAEAGPAKGAARLRRPWLPDAVDGGDLHVEADLPRLLARRIWATPGFRCLLAAR